MPGTTPNYDLRYPLPEDNIKDAPVLSALANWFRDGMLDVDEAIARAAAGVVEEARQSAWKSAQLDTEPIAYDLVGGIYQQPRGTDVVTEANGYPPGEDRGFLIMLAGPDAGKKGRLYVGIATGLLWVQEKYGSTAPWGAWRRVGGSGGGSADAGHAMGVDGQHRKQELIRRKGGQIGVGTRGVIALRFDHHNPTFQDKVLPLLKARGLPYSHAQYALALSPTQENGYAGDEQTGMTWAQVQDASLRQGGETASHSYTHGDTTDYERETFGALEFLESQMPEIAVDSFIQPGIAGSAWGGMALNLDKPSQWRDYEAGRMIRDAYGLYTGSGSLYWPLTGDASDGIPYTSFDTTTSPTSAINIINACADLKYGAVLMLHPNRVDDGAGGISTATLTAILDHLVAMRDAGEILVLTLTGMAVASTHHDVRSNVLEGTDFDLSRWQNTTGWTAAAGVASTTAGGTIKRPWTPGATSWVLGGTREAACEFRAPEGATVLVKITDYTTPAKLTTSRQVVLPASPDWKTVRQPYIVPKTTLGLHFEVGRVSGGPVDMRNPGMFAI